MKKAVVGMGVALVAMGLVDLGPISTSSASTSISAECDGREATIVATRGTVEGTEGADVIVVDGARRVFGLGGDDSICFVGTVRSSIVDGAGDDLVRNDSSFDPSEGYVRPAIYVTLEGGADTFIGGVASDNVVALSGQDVILTGGGYDRVEVGTNLDPDSGAKVGGRVELGPEGGTVNIYDPVSDDFTISGGPGGPRGEDGLRNTDDDSRVSLLTRGPWSIDADRGRISRAGRLALSATSVGYYSDRRIASFVGTSGPDVLTASIVDRADFGAGKDAYGGGFTYVDLRDVDLGPGDDTVELRAFESDAAGVADREVRGGQGHDLLRFRDYLGVDLDLRTDLLRIGDGRNLMSVPGFDKYELMGVSVRATGSDGPDKIRARACGRVLVAAGLGDDLVTVRHQPPGYDEEYDIACAESGQSSDAVRAIGGYGDDVLRGLDDRSDQRVDRTEIEGGPGDDVITTAGSGAGGSGADQISASGPGPNRLAGGSGPDTVTGLGGDDVLLGGDGRDTARGGRGRDRCVAEVRTACER